MGKEDSVLIVNLVDWADILHDVMSDLGKCATLTVCTCLEPSQLENIEKMNYIPKSVMFVIDKEFDTSQDEFIHLVMYLAKSDRYIYFNDLTPLQFGELVDNTRDYQEEKYDSYMCAIPLLCFVSKTKYYFNISITFDDEKD